MLATKIIRHQARQAALVLRRLHDLSHIPRRALLRFFSVQISFRNILVHLTMGSLLFKIILEHLASNVLGVQLVLLQVVVVVLLVHQLQESLILQT